MVILSPNFNSIYSFVETPKNPPQKAGPSERDIDLKLKAKSYLPLKVKSSLSHKITSFSHTRCCVY